MIKAPFNFVPLADKVYFPDWADQVSQDLPFKDGLDGYLTVELKAETPIFVRNGHTRAEGENKTGDYCSSAVTPDGRYFLPATSVKGAFRSILEIMSYGKMRLDERAMFAQREWDNKDLYTIKDINVQKRLCCGWLVRRNGNYYIRKCAGTPYRINQLRLDQGLQTDIFLQHFSKGRAMISLKDEQTIGDKSYDPKTAVYKYRLLESAGITRDSLRGLRFAEDVEFAVEFQERRVALDPQGDIKGTIVLTGQPDLASWPTKGYKRKIGDGKFYEFVFADEIETEIPLSQTDFDHFKFIYQESPDWEYGKNLLDGDGIPVFFRMKGSNMQDFGLAFLYKLPYENSPSDLERSGNRYKGHSTDDCDLADCIFGFARDRQSLRGRVQLSNFISNNALPDQSFTLVLNSPKASYYPIYISQDGKEGTTTRYLTYNDGRLAGWKRYHVRNLIWEKKTGDPKLDTTIYPLQTGSVFSGRIYFHNLKPVELGALISAITFHGDQDHCYHQIGQGKPYGFGKLSVQLTHVELDQTVAGYQKHGTSYFMALFEEQMNKTISSWYCSSPIIQLFSIAHQDVTNSDVYKYMELSMKDDTSDGINEFADEKKEKRYLQAYSQLCRTTYPAPSYTHLLSGMNEVVKLLQSQVEKLNKDKSLVRKYLKVGDKTSWNQAKELFDTQIVSLANQLISDDNYQTYQSEADPIIDGERATDLERLTSEIGTGPVVVLTGGNLAEHIGTPSSPEMVFTRIKKWLEAGNTVENDVDVMASKIAESFVLKKMKSKEIQQWKDESRFDAKWKKLTDIVGRDIAYQVFQAIL